MDPARSQRAQRLRGSGCSTSKDCGIADSLADALFDAIATARVPKGTLDVPVRPHARRLPSGQRGITRAMLRAIRRFFRARGGALGMLMGDLIKEEGFEWSVCALTRSTGNCIPATKLPPGLVSAIHVPGGSLNVNSLNCERVSLSIGPSANTIVWQAGLSSG